MRGGDAGAEARPVGNLPADERPSENLLMSLPDAPSGALIIKMRASGAGTFDDLCDVR